LGLGQDPPDDLNMRESVRRMVDPSAAVRPVPNIVVVLAESTFDPDYVFDLQQPVSSWLFRRNALTHSVGPLHVNAVGGGTWMSEFEVLTGLDTRLFGYKGFYTHVELAPYAKRTFVRYLKEKGYETAAFFGTDGSFFHARAAFGQYGFETFTDKDDLGLRAGNWLASDEQIVNAVIQAGSRTERSTPFFYFVQLLENHAPHYCTDYASADDFENGFKRKASFMVNCRLNQYLRHLRSTESAIQAMARYLGEVEKLSHRPFVLLVFGDHQPHTFTGTGRVLDDYRPMRRVMDPRVTFYHVMSSSGSAVRWSKVVSPPLTLLPTLLSAYVTRDVADIYLPVSWYAYETCGRDPIGTGPSQGLLQRGDFQTYLGIPEESPSCAALPEIISALRRSGVMAMR
jgi:hypothetical protein